MDKRCIVWKNKFLRVLPLMMAENANEQLKNEVRTNQILQVNSQKVRQTFITGFKRRYNAVVYDANADQATTFTTIFWNQFNAKRGYNSFNLAMAQYLEKALDDDGKFQEFKEYVKSKGYDWERGIFSFCCRSFGLGFASNGLSINRTRCKLTLPTSLFESEKN